MPQATRAPQQLFYYLKDRILQTDRATYFELESIPTATGFLVARSLAEDGEVERRSPTLGYDSVTETLSVNMATFLHNCCLSWTSDQILEALLQGSFTSNESRHVNIGGNSGFYGSFLSPWAGSYKEPDTYIINYESPSPLPTVVIESGYAESTARLYADRDLWLQGGAPHVNVVILIKWNKRVDNHIEGWIELHRRGGSDVPERFTLFPETPPGTPPQRHLILFRSDLYPGGIVPAGRNANDTWLWSLDSLREHARFAMRMEGLVEA